MQMMKKGGEGAGGGLPSRPAAQGLDAEFPEIDGALVKLHGCAVDNYKRLEDLRRAMINLRDGIGVDKDSAWPHLLAKFHLVSKTYLALSQNLLQAVKDAGLAEFVVFPKQVPADPDAASEILRTKPEAEIEQQEKTNQREIEAEMGTESAPIEERIAAFNNFVEDVQKKFDVVRKKFEMEGRDLAPPDEPEAPKKEANPEEALLQVVQKGVF